MRILHGGYESSVGDYVKHSIIDKHIGSERTIVNLLDSYGRLLEMLVDSDMINEQWLSAIVNNNKEIIKFIDE